MLIDEQCNNGRRAKDSSCVANAPSRERKREVPPQHTIDDEKMLFVISFWRQKGKHILWM